MLEFRYLGVMAIVLIATITLVAYALSPTDYFPRIIGGIQIEIDVPNSIFDKICSTGFPAYFKVLPSNPDRPITWYFGFVTASHCGEEGYDVYQPRKDSDHPEYYRGYIYKDPGHPRLTDSAFVLTERKYDYTMPTPETIADGVLHYGSEIPILGYSSDPSELSLNTVIHIWENHWNGIWAIPGPSIR